MEILTELDGLQEALKKVKMDEAVLPYVNGRLVNAQAFNKTQKILDCSEMMSAHKYLYNLDLDQLTEEDIDKIDKLYALGCERGFIQDDLTKWDDELSNDAGSTKDTDASNPTVDKQPEQKSISGTLFKAKIPCWTIIYSATSKDGNIKTGEAYSNAISMTAAKADVQAKLSTIGYSNISILAIEATDECDYAAQNAVNAQAVSDVHEDDILKGRAHNAHVAEDDESEADGSDGSSSDSDETEDGADGNDDSSDDGENADSDGTDSEDQPNEDANDDSETDEDLSDDTADDDSSDDDSEDDSKSDDDSNSDDGDDSEDSEDDDSDDSKDDSDEDDSKDDDDSDSDSEDDDDDKKELDANQKSELKDKYRKAFKNTLVKCKFDTSFNDLTLEQKVKFFTELSKAWHKNEPTEFMTDKEVEQLNNIIVKSGSDD